MLHLRSGIDAKNQWKIKKEVVGAWRFELQTSCAQGSCKKSILLVRLALFYVMVYGFGPNLAVVGPKLDPNCEVASPSCPVILMLN